MSDPLREPNLSLLVILSNMGVNVCPRLATNEGSNKRKMRGLNKKEKKRAAYHAGAEGGACVGSTDELLIAQSLLAVIKTGGFKKLNKPLLRSMHASYEAEGKTIIDEDRTPTQEMFNIVISELEKKLQTQ